MSEWKREIEEIPARLVPVPCSESELSDVQGWLQGKAKEHGLRWLLAHADDGVIWGKVLDDGTLVTSHEAAKGNKTAKNICPELRCATLQQARLFGKEAELLLWRDGDNVFHGRLIVNAKDGETPGWKLAFDEPQLLWGTPGASLLHEFTLLEDGAQGLRHAVPLPANTPKLRAQLCVRHYLAQEDFARVVVSRLVELKWKEK
ncbi:MAG: CRISPR-associated protein Csx19 [Acidobacteriota bacterium]